MSFLDVILRKLEDGSNRIVLEELRSGQFFSTTGGELLAKIWAVRQFLQQEGVIPGDRCVLVASNGIGWTCINLAIMAQGAICVPLYSRQSPRELAGMIRDCRPALIFCGDQKLLESLQSESSALPKCILLEPFFSELAAKYEPSPTRPAYSHAGADVVTIIYTSGTSGEPKGVLLNTGNLDHMLGCTNARLDQLMQAEPGGGLDRVYHYLPCNFAGSWVLLLTSLMRGSRLCLCTDLNRIGEDIPLVAPHYFLNVPALLERIRSGVEEKIRKSGGAAMAIYQKACSSWERRMQGTAGLGDAFWLGIADRLIFRAVRARLGPNLKALICGSAPLAEGTQQFFHCMGIRVLQVYGLTETTAICTMDDPDHAIPGKVGPAIPGVEMQLGASDEILVRGPNIFPGYWNRPNETESVFHHGWFRTGDQGQVDPQGNWQIIGRIKNLLILASGHNVAPEPLEETLLKSLPGIKQVVIIGHGRGSLAALLTGEGDATTLAKAIEDLNQQLPHYKRIRGFRLLPEVFSIENGLLTANGKLKRDAIQNRWSEQIEAVYDDTGAAGRKL